MRCCVKNCNNDAKRKTKADGITFHVFPRERNLRQAWLDALGTADWEPKERSVICSEHFRSEDFYQTKCGIKKIKNGVVPCLRLNNDGSEEPVTTALQDEQIVYLMICRICMAVDTRMYDTRHYQLGEVYRQITGKEWSASDSYPQRVCWECASRLAACARLRARAHTSHALMTELLRGGACLRLQDVKAASRCHTELQSCLVTKVFEPNEFNVYYQDTGEAYAPTAEDGEDVKAETDMSTDKYLDIDSPKITIDTDIQPIASVEVKDERSDDIFFDEMNDFDDSDDNVKLSEVAFGNVEFDGKEEDEPPSEIADKPRTKVKRKKVKVKVEKEKKVREPKRIKKKDGEEPNETVDKYKTTGVKRRKHTDGLDESLFNITTLTYEEQIAEIQKRQESAAYKSAPYKCSVCYRGFLVSERYNAHAVRHSDQSGLYECFVCRTRLKTGRALRKHITAQHTEMFSCKGCPFTTRNRGVAREHERWHSGTRYQCPHCPSEFDKLTTYMGHIRIKHVSDFVCELCGFTFVSRKGIDVHKKKKHRLAEKTVALEGPYCCVCDVTFVSEEAHARHLKLSSKHSSDADPNRIRNDSQSVNTERNGRYMRRIERRPLVHARDPARPAQGPVACEQCGVTLRDLRLYAQHFRRAHPDKNRTKYPAMKTPCMCEQCGRIFQSMALLKDHMWVHTGEKRFKCDRCDKSFTQKTNLVFHMRVHAASRPTYECPLCGKHFAFFNNRRRHMFIHTGLKPFKCETCGKCFTTAGEQRAHVEHVHLKKPWPKRARPRRDAPAWPHAGEPAD